MTALPPHSWRRSSPRRSGGWRLVLSAVILLAGVLGAGSAFGAEPQINLSLRPVDAEGAYFDLALRPGEARTLAVELANLGEVTIAARTYAADVYTIINGGFGARLRDEPTSGTTVWLDYPSDVTSLAPGNGVTRSFTVSVPADAAPGEYITSIILENDVPIQGTGSVTLDQIVRQAMAVVISVPGPRLPGLTIGTASHKIATERSTVAVVVENTGNVRLRPVANFVLRDASGAQVSQAQVPMDTFYAHTATLVEVPLAALLQPGQYTVGLVLEDGAASVRVEEDAILLEVVAVPPPAGDGTSTVPGLTEVIQTIGEGRVPPVAGLGLAAAGLLVTLIVGLLILAFVRRRRVRLERDRVDGAGGA